MSLENGYLLEPSREGRLLNRWRLNQSMQKYDIPEGNMQSMIPHALLRDPIEPELRRVFHVPMREMFTAASLHFSVNTMLVANKYFTLKLHANPSNASDVGDKGSKEHDIARSKESHDKEAAEIEWLSELVKNNELAGQDQGKDNDLNIKVFVFMQNAIPEDVLTSFLDTIPDALPGQSSYSYVFPLGNEPDLEEVPPTESNIHHVSSPTLSDSGRHSIPGPVLTGRIRFMHELAATQSEKSLEDETYAQSQGSEEDTIHSPADSDIEHRSKSSLGSIAKSDQVSTTEPGFTLSHRFLAKHYLSQPSPFNDKTLSEINKSWLHMIEPYSDVPSLYSMHAYIILDDQTAQDCETVLLVSETNETIQRRRIDFTALREGITLKGLESLSFDLDQLPGDWSGVIRGPVMQEACRLEALYEERSKRAKERYYKKNEKDVEGSPTSNEAMEEKRGDIGKEDEKAKQKGRLTKEPKIENSAGKPNKSWKSKFKWGRKSSTSTP